ncbi:MAG: hypothetical protein ABIJ33_02030 [Patescibacteria group bacterium]
MNNQNPTISHQSQNRLVNWLKKLTFLKGKAKITQTRELSASPIRELCPPNEPTKPAVNLLKCPYCLSTNHKKRGFRQKKLERVQLYLCLNCQKTFTPQITKGKHYPLDIMLDAISTYNLGYSLEATCKIINRRQASQQAENHLVESLDKQTEVYTITLQPSTLSHWLEETTELCRFARMRQYALKKYAPRDLPDGRRAMVATATLAHRQLYRYRFHLAKCQLIIADDFKHRHFGPLREFLQMVPGECPHQYFQDGLRASETPMTFSKKQMIVRAKQNYATRICSFVLQSVKDRRQRHEALQKFMLANDSVTVATEVPVYIMRDDLEHLQTQLGFEMYLPTVKTKADMADGTKLGEGQRDGGQNNVGKGTGSTTAGSNIGTGMGNNAMLAGGQGTRDKGQNNIGNGTGAATAGSNIGTGKLPHLITGHIDFLQIRNGQIHILDYKPNAHKERPIEQLTLYAMALSRLTGLRLFEFKCAWFDENNYYEFYPLHVLYKPQKGRRRRKIDTKEGVYTINQNAKKIESIQPLAEEVKKYVIH